jgi:uncharacterized protein YndB with AHSA1/START domain
MEEDDNPHRRGAMHVTRPFRFDRTWTLPVTPARLWSILGRTDEYVTWWSWLREFEATGLESGTTARCTIQSPLPYSLRCAIQLDEVVAGERISTTVDGDLRGPAVLVIREHPDGATARLAWSVTLGDPMLAALATVARPAMAWAHDQVVAIGFRQFLDRAVGTTAPP